MRILKTSKKLTSLKGFSRAVIRRNARRDRQARLRKAASIEEKKQALFDYLKQEDLIDEDITLEDISVIGDYFEVDGLEYLVATYDEAEKIALEDVKRSFEEMGFEACSEDFKEQMIDYMLDEEKLENLMKEEISSYVDSMDEEEIINSLESYVDDPEEIPEYLRNETLVEKMTEDRAQDPVNYWFKEYMDDEEFEKFVQKNDLVDWDKAASEVVRLDGMANTLATYDGEEIDLDNNLLAFRTN